jgi:hypothetical protein
MIFKMSREELSVTGSREDGNGYQRKTEMVQTGFNWPWTGFSGKLLATWH